MTTRRVIIATETALVIVVYAILLWLVLSMVVQGRSGAPVSMAMWKRVADICQRCAYAFGRAGIAAEQAYWQSVTKVTGG